MTNESEKEMVVEKIISGGLKVREVLLAYVLDRSHKFFFKCTKMFLSKILISWSVSEIEV